MQILLPIFFLLLIGSNNVLNFNCGTDKLKKKPAKIGNQNIIKERRLNNNYSPIKIKADYTYLKSQMKYKEQLFNEIKGIFEETFRYFSLLLETQHQSVILKEQDIKEECGIPTFDRDYKNFLYENDIIIFPLITKDFPDGVLAAATPCLVLTNGKPVGGVVYLNENLTFNKGNTKQYMELLLLHEISHVLVFHPFFFEVFDILKEEIVDGEVKTYIKSKKVLEKAKLHFSCSQITGLQLEDQGDDGSVGSHWEARYMLGDYMISTDYSETVISDITLALFEDSGLYKVNYFTGGLFRFGKNKGCDFFYKKCIENGVTSFPNEFCTKQYDPFCSSSHLSSGYCYIITYKSLPQKYQYFSDSRKGGFEPVDYCPVNMDYFSKNNYYDSNCRYGTKKNYFGETIGGNSLCFESSIGLSETRSVCYEVSCNKKKKKSLIKIAGTTVECPKEGGVISKNGGEINCPKFNLICTSDIWCNDPFDCINKRSLADDSTYAYEDDLYLKASLNKKMILLLIILLEYFL